MTNGMRLRRYMRTWGKHRAAAVRGKRAAGTARRHSAQRESRSGTQYRFAQMVICGVLFASLILLKLLLPGNLAVFRGTLAQWLVQDADFAEAFSAVGKAVAEPEHFTRSLGDAYTAVFGESDAVEVSGTEEIGAANGAVWTEKARALPEYASAEQPELAFAYRSPLEGTLTSPFGWREDPNSGTERFHTGVDLAADEGTAFTCFADGTVGVVGESTVLGKYLTVQHADGCETLYAHCSRISVVSGQSVVCGDTLGAVGATGNATGAHLHFELLSGSKYVDPITYVTKTA